MCQGTENRRTWDVHFIRGPNDWKANVVDDFFLFLASNLPLVSNGDREVEIDNKRGFYYRLILS